MSMSNSNTHGSKKIKMAAIQMASGPNVDANLFEAERLISKAAKAGAKLCVLPENFAIMGMTERDKVVIREKAGNGHIQNFLAEQAKKHQLWLVGGTIPLEANDDNKIRSACLFFDPQGKCVARYDKIHLFDVHMLNTEEQYTESETIEAGDKVVVVQTPFLKVGFAICYDLRFPELFRKMHDEGVELIVIPSAFTAITGKAHWETLVRARAIENLSYVIASDQGGYHINGRESFGDSMIVDPWGQVLDRLTSGSGYVIADIDLAFLVNTRKRFPVLAHRKI